MNDRILWEYLMKNIYMGLLDEFEALGNEGWELCSMIEKTRKEYAPTPYPTMRGEKTIEYFQCTFKRQKHENRRRLFGGVG